jgi:hypothetical protein
MFAPYLDLTPDTSGYLYLGYGFLFVMMAIYLISIYLRQRNFKRDVELMEELEKKEKK